MKRIFYFLSCTTSLICYSQTASKYTISGYITEAGSKENLPGVSIYNPKLKAGTTSNSYGFYSLTLPSDSVSLVFSFVGYKAKQVTLLLNKNITLGVELMSDTQLDEVTVSAEEQKKVSDEVQMSSIDLPVEQIKKIPALLGEKDVIKVLQLMPGVQKGSEGSSGFYVRGGGPDQNLIILDDATVYNANHLFGFFSIFNGDALKSVELIKGGFPARYGGRLSSVLDMQMKDGNKEKIHGEAGIGLLSSRLTLEGPIIKNKCSFLISARRTYIDALIYPFLPKNEKGGYYFYDLNAKLNYILGPKDRLFLSGYFGQDKFYFNNEDVINKTSEKTNLNWGNATTTLRWNHLFNPRLFANTSFIFTNYKLGIGLKSKGNTDYFNLSYNSGIRDFSGKINFDFMPNPNHFIRFGAIITHHRFTPNAYVVKSSNIQDNQKKVRVINAIETGIFIEDDWKITQKLRINAGIRLSHFYAESKNYLNPEPRLAVRYMLRKDLSLKASFSTMNQYLHLLSNTGIGLPTDLWVPATATVKPQQSQQVALGIAKDFTEKNFAVTIEGYYKKTNHIIGYKEGASFLSALDFGQAEEVKWEDNVTAGKGWSYGGELLIQKKKGKFTGWIGYTLSWTQLQFNELNLGKKFYARYDRRHDISLVGIYDINDHITVSATWVYGTGNAISLPLASYEAVGHQVNSPNNYSYSTVNDYGNQKNDFRMAAYHRMDVGIQFHKQKKHSERIFELSFYNVYNRKNPYFYYASQEQGYTKLKQVSLFPILPSVSWTYKF